MVYKYTGIAIIFGLIGLNASLGFASDRLQVFVSILPQKYLVQQIGADEVDVRVMVQPGASPATYEPKPRQMAALSRARLYFAIGVPFEAVWLKRITAVNPKMGLIHTDQGIRKISMDSHHGHHDDHSDHDRHSDHDGHSHHGGKHEDSHGHGALDPHIWLSPPLVKIQAQTILSALVKIDPEKKHLYQTNYKNFIIRVGALDDELRRSFKGKQGQPFMVFHPSWGYFAQAYGLKQIAIEMEGKSPKPAQLKELIAHAREEKIRVVFVQPQFSTKSAKLIAEAIGGRVVFVDPLAEDWMDNLRKVARTFNAAFQ